MRFLFLINEFWLNNLILIDNYLPYLPAFLDIV